MKALNRLLMSIVTLGTITSCGAPDNSGDIIDQAKSPDITIIKGETADNNDPIEFKCNNDVNDLEVDWGDGKIDSEHSHTYAEAMSYTITISGHVTSLSFSDENGLYALGNERVREVSFSSTITTLPKYSFNIYDLSTVVIPDSIKNVGEYAFNRSRHKIMFYVSTEQKPEGWADTWSNVRSFRDLAIWGLKIGISNNYIHIMREYNEANVAITILYNNKNTELFIPDAVVFKKTKFQISIIDISSSKVVTIHLPKYLKIFGGFHNCEHLTTIDYFKCSSLMSVDTNAFGDCPSLREVVIPKTIKSIPEGIVFSNCDNISKITVEAGNPIYHSPSNSNVVMKGDKVVLGCKGSIIPEGAKSIGKEVFAYSKIENVNMPDSLEKIEEYAFSNCKNLKSIRFSNNLQEIDTYAFINSTLETVTFPVSLKSIGDSAFAYCDNLTTIYVDAFSSKESIPTCDYGAFQFFDSGTKTFYYHNLVEPDDFVQKGWPAPATGDQEIKWSEKNK